MKKLLALLLIIAMLIPVLAACDEAESSMATTKNTNTEKPTQKPVDEVLLPGDSSEGLRFELNEDKKSYTLIKMGACDDVDVYVGTYLGLPVTEVAADAFSSAWCREYLESVTFYDGVTKIGKGAFYGCKNLKRVNLPNTLVEIGSEAFADCKSLKNIDIPSSVTTIAYDAFEESPYLSNMPTDPKPEDDDTKNPVKEPELDGVVDPDQPWADPDYYVPFVSSDGKYMLERSDIDEGYNIVKYLGNEKDVTVPCIYDDEYILVINKNAFSGSECETVVIENFGYVAVIEEEAFANCSELRSIQLADTICNINERAFYGCKKLESIEIPTSCFVREYAFANCESLKSVKLSLKQTYIMESTFSGCTSLKSIELPNCVTHINNNAFENCTSLEDLVIPKGVEKIENAFINCRSLKNVTLDEQNIYYDFVDNCLIEKSTKTLILALDNCTVPDDGSVAIFGKYSFSGCKEIASLVIPASVKGKISGDIFKSCQIGDIVISQKNYRYIEKDGCLVDTWEKRIVIGAVGATIPADSDVEIIGAYAFNGRGVGETLVIPEGIKKIEAYAFCDCEGLAEVYLPKSLTEIETHALDNCPKVMLIEYAGSTTELAAISKADEWAYNVGVSVVKCTDGEENIV